MLLRITNAIMPRSMATNLLIVMKMVRAAQQLNSSSHGGFEESHLLNPARIVGERALANTVESDLRLQGLGIFVPSLAEMRISAKKMVFGLLRTRGS
jgi:hypothetical protein